MSRKIATIYVTKQDAMDAFMSYDYIRATRGSESGPLHKMVSWLHDQSPMTFSLEHMRLGKPKDDYVMLYYHEGLRYKILRDGTALVTGADAEELFEARERELQALVDSILNDEIVTRIRAACQQAGYKSAKARYLDEVEGERTKCMIGVFD